jgi:hypothetical protein
MGFRLLLTIPARRIDAETMFPTCFFLIGRLSRRFMGNRKMGRRARQSLA